MSSFLDRLKKKDVIPASTAETKDDKVQQQVAASVAANPPTQSAEQLKVDIFQTETAIVIYAQMAGTSVHDFNVMIEGDDDIVTIKGNRTRPNGEHFQSAELENKEHVLEECSWGPFYRQIILPSEVDPEKTEAKMHEGVLMLLLPLKTVQGKGKRIQVMAV